MPHYRLLQENSERIQIVQLSGYLFFGSVSALNDQMYERITQNTSSDVTFVLLDFSSTTGIDISAISAFARLLNKGEGYNLCFILIDMHPNFIQQLNNLTGIEDEKNYYIILNDLDQGLRYAEDQIIEENINQMKSETNRLNQSKLFDQVADDMLQELEDLEYIEKILKDLEPYSVAYELKKGEILLQPAQEIHGFFWIQYGKLVEKDNQSPGSGSIKEYISGDVLNIEGLFRKTEIQSTLKAETGCSLQYFSRLNIAELEKSDPQRCSQLYALLLRKMVS
jgi:SulP family sulfate permease